MIPAGHWVQGTICPFPRPRGGDPHYKKEGETMEHEYEALFRAILELIDKCDTIEELRESVKRIMGEG